MSVLRKAEIAYDTVTHKLKFSKDGGRRWRDFSREDENLFKVERLILSFDTPNILTGITFYIPIEGDVLVGALSYVSVLEAFDGSGNPTIQLQPLGSETPGDFTSVVVSTADNIDSIGQTKTPVFSFKNMENLILTGPGPYTVLLDDGAGNDPESSQGVCEIVWWISPRLTN